MKEHKDDVLLSLDSATSDGVVAKKGKVEGNLGEDVMVDVVSADMVVDDAMEDVESSVKTLEKDEVVSVEVVKEVVQESVVTAVASGSGCDGAKSGNRPVIVDYEMASEPSSKEAEVLSSLKRPESTEGDVVMEEGLVGKGKAEDGASNEVVNAGTCEDDARVSTKNMENEVGVDQTKKESVQSTVEDTKHDSQKCGNGIGVTEEAVERATESVQEAADVDCVMSEKTGTDEVLDSTKIPDSVTKVKVDQMNKEETEAEDSKMDDEPEETKVEIDVMDKGDETELGFTKETLEQPVNSVQEVADGDHGSSKIPHSSIMASLGLEEDDVDVVDETLEEKNEAQDQVSVEPSSFATIKADEVVACSEVDQVMTDQKEPDVVATVGFHSQFSYEDTHMDRGEDAGMDIDEVLGWKDEIPFIQENTNSVSLQQSCYFHPPETEGQFSVSDLVWGKVRSHPWWPGQIFDPSDASQKAIKHHKKDCFLVAYFGDRTFGWNDSTVLKPFRENFSQTVEHMNSEPFNNAVHCALEEVSRRVELGLTCSCIAHDIYENIKYQIVENSGIKQESSKRYGVDMSASVNSFEPGMLVDYVRLLAKFPHDANDKMELTMAKAQLSSYGRFKGHRQLAEFQSCGDLLEVEQVVKNEPCYEDGSKKQKAIDSIGGSIKRKALDSIVDVNDSYWTDRIVQNQNGGGEHEHEQEKLVKPTRRSNKKRYFNSNHEIEAKEQLELIERRQKNLPTEVLMKFTEGVYFPSEIHLSKMFRRFGALLESETEVDRQSGRARVVFKKCSDAEVAHSSAGKFNIFGSIVVNYELNYTPVISYKPLPLPVAQDAAHAC